MVTYYPLLCKTFQLTAHSYVYSTRCTTQYKVVIPPVRSCVYGLRCFTCQSIHQWNILINRFKDKTSPHEKQNCLQKNVK